MRRKPSSRSANPMRPSTCTCTSRIGQLPCEWRICATLRPCLISWCVHKYSVTLLPATPGVQPAPNQPGRCVSPPPWNMCWSSSEDGTNSHLAPSGWRQSSRSASTILCQMGACPIWMTGTYSRGTHTNRDPWGLAGTPPCVCYITRSFFEQLRHVGVMWFFSHLLQLLPMIFSQQNSHRISKSTMKHLQNPD